MRNYFKTGKRLAIAIDNAHRIEGFEEYLESYHLSMYDIQSFGTIEYGLPYYIEPVSLNNVDLDNDEYAVEAIFGYHISWPNVGDTVELAGGQYKVIDTFPLGAEVELQADDGKHCHYYIGESYLKIYQKVA